MAHESQIRFCEKVKRLYPHLFRFQKVLDCGSLDINGNNRYLFEDCDYLGIDITEGDNVDKVCYTDEMQGEFDVVISTEMLEHDVFHELSLIRMAGLAGKLLIITTAGPTREEHGTYRRSPADSPATNYFYRNMTLEDFEPIKPFFKEYELLIENDDIFFYGIKWTQI